MSQQYETVGLELTDHPLKNRSGAVGELVLGRASLPVYDPNGKDMKGYPLPEQLGINLANKMHIPDAVKMEGIN